MNPSIVKLFWMTFSTSQPKTRTAKQKVATIHLVVLYIYYNIDNNKQHLLPFLSPSGCSFGLVIHSAYPLFKGLPEKHFEPSTDLQQTVLTVSFQLYKKQQAVSNESEKNLIPDRIFTCSIERLDLCVLFHPFEKQFYLPAPTVDVAQFFCF